VRSDSKASSAASKRPLGNSWSSRRATALLAGLVLAALVAFVALAAAATPERLRSFGPDGTEATDFSHVGSVALDQQSESVYVLDEEAGHLYKFDAGGQPLDWGGTASYVSGNRIEGLDPFTGRQKSQVAVNSETHLLYVTEKHAVRAFQANGEPAEFSAGLGAETSEIPGFGELVGVAVDGSGNIYASDRAGTISIFSPSGAQLTSFAAQDPGNLVVDTTGAVWVINNDRDVQKFTPDALPVSASTTYTVNTTITVPLSTFPSSISADPSTDEIYISNTNFKETWIRKYDKSGAFIEAIGEPGTASESAALKHSAQGIAVFGEERELQPEESQPGVTVKPYAKLYAGNSGHDGFGNSTGSQVDIFGTEIVEGPPSVVSTSAIALTADSATLRAVINPNTAEATYRFEYGTEDCSLSICASVPLGGGEIAAGHEPVTVTQAIAGLQPGTTYHYRVLAESSFGPSEGPDQTFTTQTPGLGFQLADSRVWEMVSPSDKHGGQLEGSSHGHVQASADGNGVVYTSRGSIEAEPDGSRLLESTTVLARRGSGGWQSKDVSPPNSRVMPLAVGHLTEYKLFTADLSRALLDPRDGTNLSPQASERAPHLRVNTEPPLYTPLVSGKEGFANVPPGTVFGGGDHVRGDVRIAGATPDFSHVALLSEVPLVEGAPRPGLYLWSAGQLQPLNVLPTDEGGEIVAANWIGSGPGSVQNAVSADGSRVFWSRGAYGRSGNSVEALYLRDTVAQETARLDVVQPGASGADSISFAGPVFQGASADGTVVFFTDSRQLTEDASPAGEDLYRCEIPAGPAPSGCATLTDISAPLASPGESAEVQGLAAGVSEDGTRIYFVAKGVLDDEPNQRGQRAEAKQFNLYRWQQGGGVRFVATLDPTDAAVWGGSFGQRLNSNTATSPDGRYLSFMSQRSLTGYVNLDVTSGEPVQEVFRYDAAQDRLDCVSCNPSGGAPEGQAGVITGRLVDRNLWLHRWVAATLPQPPIVETAGVSLYQPRAVLDNGRIFFNAIDSLVPADSNGQWDVYQWEPTGVGDCTASSAGASISPSAGGCVSLLSSGSAEREAGFLDASQSGDDVFFLTSARLSVTDEDEELDVYDARVNGVAATLSPRSECQGEACQSPPPPPLDPTPASSAFEGQGNVRAQGAKRCAKGKRKVRRGGKVRCLARKQRAKRKAAHKRRAAR
jgi:hypothetical protein